MLLPRQKLARGANDKEHTMSQTVPTAIAVIGIDIRKKATMSAERFVLRQVETRSYPDPFGEPGLDRGATG